VGHSTRASNEGCRSSEPETARPPRLRITPTKKKTESVARTTWGSPRWYRSAIGGPPTDVAVPVAPATKPAVARVAGLSGTSTVWTVRATATSTITASASPICSSVNDATSQAPRTVPGTRAGSDHAVERQSTCSCSSTRFSPAIRRASHRVSTGTIEGATSATTGALSRPSPRPTTAWT
jgi:hypothetical protein